MQLEPRMRLAINAMAVSIHRILADAQPSIYLYGSVTAEDYRQGWSDIDLLVLTQLPISCCVNSFLRFFPPLPPERKRCFVLDLVLRTADSALLKRWVRNLTLPVRESVRLRQKL